MLGTIEATEKSPTLKRAWGKSRTVLSSLPAAVQRYIYYLLRWEARRTRFII
jgi:hypothetical protein